MAFKTYIPGIIALVKTACRFMDRYDAKIRANIGEDYVATYDALKSACDAFEAIIPFIEPAISD